MKIKKGFSLLELTLVLGIGSMMAFLKFQDMRNEQETIIANAVGSQIKQLGEAVNRYIRAYPSRRYWRSQFGYGQRGETGAYT